MYKTDLKTSDLQESNKMIGGDVLSNFYKGRISDPTPITDELKKLTSVNNVIKTTTEKLKKISSKFDFLYNKTVGLTSYISSDSALSPEEESKRLEQSRQNKGMLIDAAKASYAAATEAAIEKYRKESGRSSSDRNVEDEDEDGFSMSKTTRGMILHKLGIVDLTSDSENKDKNIFYTMALPMPEEMSNNIYSNLPNGFTTDVFFSTLFKETKPIDIGIPILQHILSNDGTKSYATWMLNFKKDGKSSDTSRSDKSDSRSPTGRISSTIAEVVDALVKPKKLEEKEKAINTAIKQSINDKLFKTNPQLDTDIATLTLIKDDIKAL